jgi:DUF4097 and DUF4098 domain-containing protein YvlB
MMTQKWNFFVLQTEKSETNRYEIHEEYTNISININTANLVILPTEEDSTTVECFEQEKIKHIVQVKDDTLFIEVVDSRKWYEHIGIFFQSPKVTVYMPQKQYAAVSVKASTADMQIEKLSANHLDITLSTGDMRLTDVQCKNVSGTVSTGDIHLENVIVTQELAMQSRTGDIALEGCDANRLKIKTTTGDVKGWLLSPKVFLATANTGKVNVAQTTAGGLCEITTGTGDIDVDVLLMHVTTP